MATVQFKQNPVNEGISGFSGWSGMQGMQGLSGFSGQSGSGSSGGGVPAGGKTDQVLAKNSDADQDASWLDITWRFLTGL